MNIISYHWHNFENWQAMVSNPVCVYPTKCVLLLTWVFRQAKSLHFPRNIKCFSGPIFYSIDVFMLLFDGDSDNGRYGLFDNASTISILMHMFLFSWSYLRNNIIVVICTRRGWGGDKRESFCFATTLFLYDYFILQPW